MEFLQDTTAGFMIGYAVSGLAYIIYTTIER